MKKILILQGSTRENSFNKQLAKEIEKMLEGRAEVKYLDYQNDVPFMNQDLEVDTPEAIKRIRNEVEETDGLWIISPQYNESYPAIVKNVLDWLSRPKDINNMAKGSAIKGVKVTVSGIGGSTATKQMREKITDLLKFIGADVVVESVGTNVNKEVWTGGDLVISEEALKAFKEQADKFVEAI